MGGIIHRVENLLLPSSMANAWIAPLGAAAAMAVAYFWVARLPAHLAVFWPGSGIAAGILIGAGHRAGRAVGLGVMLGSVAAIALNEQGSYGSTSLGIFNFGVVVLLTWLLPRWVGGPSVHMPLDRAEHKPAASQLIADSQLIVAETQLTSLVEHAPMAIAMFDRQMRYLAVSRRYVIDYRLPPAAQLIGRSHYEIFSDTPQRRRDLYAKVLAGEELSH